MTTSEIKEDIKKTLGLIPTFMNNIPESILEEEWKLFKKFEVEESKIPNKERELMGLAIASITKCKYCAYFHTELAKLFGATDDEIEEAVHYAKHTAGWSTYINGLQTDFDQFRKEVDKACDYVRSMEKMTEKAY